MQFASLGSGSRGNGTLVRTDDTLLLVDCGFSTKATERRMQSLGVAPNQLDAILVTHEHGDHCSGVAALSRKYQIPVYLTRGTEASGRVEGCWATEYFHSMASFTVGSLRVAPIAVPHDAREPCQFVLESGRRRLGILTDLGSITSAVVEHYRGCHALLLEFNHDQELLENGPYPASLKDRVGGDWGHLNNRQAAHLLTQIHEDVLDTLVIAHISEKNNHPNRVELVLDSVDETHVNLVWAEQDAGFDWLFVNQPEPDPLSKL